MKEYLKGLKGGLPICLGYISVSFAFGIMATMGGLSLLNAVIISLTNLTSAGQFAGVDIINSGGGLLELSIATFVINIRYLLMSLSLTQRVDSGTNTFKRLVMSFGITDENFALSMQRQESITFSYFFGIMTLPILGWTLGTFLGAYAGGVLAENVRIALGMAIYAMFVAIIVPPAKKSKPILFVILISVSVSCMMSITPVLCMVSGGWRVIISTLIASAVGAVLYPEKEDTLCRE